ncbi:MAG: ThuA domain-containing protein [Planctomycetia bacterium]|nr:ThuA domain-containing protein [Planctomycetia bacterium]
MSKLRSARTALLASAPLAAMIAAAMFLPGTVGVPLASLSPSQAAAAPPPPGPPMKVLFLGDRGHHKPADRAKQLIPVMAERGIDIRYTEDLNELNPENLAKYPALIIYGNIDKISPEQEKALIGYVENGGGLVPLHCASFCFRNSPAYIALVGGQFFKHSTGVFRDTIVEPNHPIMKGFGGFESWDETYVHAKHNEKDRLVLSYRVDKDGREPYTWVRTQGKGRVFYTAWGHDDRTWSNPGFQNLVERGIRWAAGGDPSVVPPFKAPEKAPPPAATGDALPQPGPRATGLKPFEYRKEKIAFYPPPGTKGTWDQMQLPLTTEESAKHLVLPEGFEARLFASEPQISGKPICMNWDDRGRLWVAETVDYPNSLQRDGEGHDRIVIYEDVDGDGKAGKSTIFADKLSIPTSITFANGGVIVHQAPNTLFLKDTNGDDKADERRVLFSGWGTADTHAGPSNLRWGLDNWVWGSVGYSGFKGKIGEKKMAFHQGYYRFKPDGSAFEYLCTTTNNTWGLGMTEEGLVFGSTANNCPSVYLPIPNRYYETVAGMSAKQLTSIAETHLFHPVTDKIRQVDCHAKYTAGAGHAIYTARAYPQAYWNRVAFVAEPTGHLVGQYLLERKGSAFISRDAPSFLASDDEWTAPIMAEVGPDGCVWVIDWYNYIVQHNPTPRGYGVGKGGAYETPLRDKTHARIYRIMPKGMSTPQPLRLDKATPAELVATLKNPTMLWRLHVQRLLVERGQKDVVPALVALVDDRSVDPVGLNVGAIHGLWTLNGIGALGGSDPAALAAAVRALRHPSAGVRRNAVAVLPQTEESLAAILAGSLLTDSDAQVRLASFLALVEMPRSNQAGSAIFAAMQLPENRDDRWIPDSATIAAVRHDAGFLKAALAASGNASGDAGAALDKAVKLVAANYARRGAVDSIGGTLSALKGADPRLAGAVLDGFVAGWPQGRAPELTPADKAELAALMAALPANLKDRLLTLADRFGQRDIFSGDVAGVLKSLSDRLADKSLSPAERVDAAERLVRLADTAETANAVVALIDPQAPPLLVQGLLDALAASRQDATGGLLVARLGQITPASRRTAISVLLRRPAWTLALLDAIEKQTVATTDLSDQAWQLLTTNQDAQIAERAKKAAGTARLPDPDRMKVIEKYLAEAQRSGDATHGQAIFEKKCAQCHTIAGKGAHIGPDLTGVGRRPKTDILVDILDPNRSVEANFRQWTLQTKDGLTFIGLLVAESQTTVEVIDAEAKSHVVPRENIEAMIPSKLSLMPVGVEKDTAAGDFADLLEFLSRSKEPKK